MLFDPTLEIPRYSWKLQRTYMWEIMLPDIGGVSGTFVSTFCQDIKFGDYTMEDVSSLRYGAFKAKYAGTLDIPDVTLTFLRPIPDQVTAFLYGWRELIVTKEGYYNPKSAYARSIYIYLYDTTGAITNKIQLVGCFPKDLPSWDFNYDIENVSKISCTLSVDRFAFGEFTSPVFAPDSDQAFATVDVTDTSTAPPQRPVIAAPSRFIGTTGGVAAPAKAPSLLGSVITGLIPGIVSTIGSTVLSGAKQVIGAIVRPAQTTQPAYNIIGALPEGLAKKAGAGMSWPSSTPGLTVPTDVALSLGKSILYTDSPVRAAAATTAPKALRLMTAAESSAAAQNYMAASRTMGTAELSLSSASSTPAIRPAILM